jgi:hypothetical protein
MRCHDQDFYKFISGTPTDIGNWTGTCSTGDTMKLEISGTTLTGYINGVSVGTASDSSLSTGNPGIWSFDDSGQELNDWEGGNVGGGGGPTINPAKINGVPIRGGGLLGLVKDVLRVQ